MNLFLMWLMAPLIAFVAGFAVAMVVGWLRASGLHEALSEARLANQVLKNRVMELEVERAERPKHSTKTMWG